MVIKRRTKPLVCTKNTIVEKLIEKFDLSTSDAQDTVENLLEIMKSALAFGEDVMVSGFGKFEVKEKAQRRGRNPSTGKSMMLPKRRVVTFKCSGKLRDKINGR